MAFHSEYRQRAVRQLEEFSKVRKSELAKRSELKKLRKEVALAEDKAAADGLEIGRLRSELSDIKLALISRERELQEFQSRAEEEKKKEIAEAVSKAIIDYHDSEEFKQWIGPQTAEIAKEYFDLGVEHTRRWNSHLVLDDKGPTFGYWLEQPEPSETVVGGDDPADARASDPNEGGTSSALADQEATADPSGQQVGSPAKDV